tara:strand:- start:88 stop:291 length:204 start_codon:yes stop_codon:yes gene_type:complete
MAEVSIPKRFEDDLKAMKKEIAFIKDHMVDKDSVMTEDDYESLLVYRKEKELGQLISHNDLKKELGF